MADSGSASARGGAASVVRFYLSGDATLDGQDVAVREIHTGGLRRKAVRRVAFTAEVPSGGNASGRWVIAVVDGFDGVRETDEENNTVILGRVP
jgi:CARDB